MNISSNFDQNISRFHEILDVQKNFDIVYHTLTIADKKACLYFIDGFTKDEILLRLMQDFASVKPDSFPSSAMISQSSTSITARPPWRPMIKISLHNSSPASPVF